MDGFALEALARMPLAEAVLRVWQWMADEEYLENLFEQYRGRSYKRLLSFPVLVQLIADAIVQHGGSGRCSFEHAAERNEVSATVQAMYGKLGRLPVKLSMGFLADCSQRLEALLPGPGNGSVPVSLSGFHTLILDGKTIKRVAKRLKPLRSVAGGVLGGKALVASSLRTGLVLQMHADPDGDANEVRFLPDLVPALRERVRGPRLWLADRAFCGLPQTAHFSEQDDVFVIRYRRNVRFEEDPAGRVQKGRDDQGRQYLARCGWLGTTRDPRARYVRQITLERSQEESIVLVTNLVDQRRYPAKDILKLYLSRWGIERIFQEVTQVFGLGRLIGGSPQATIFQFAFCLLLYNIIELIRAFAAAGQSRAPDTISHQKLFEDVRRQLTAWTVLVSPAATVEGLPSLGSATSLRRRLSALLRATWTPRWIKAPPQKRRTQARREPRSRNHASAYRLLNPDRPKNKTREKST